MITNQNTANTSLGKTAVASLTALLVGGMIYLLFRPKTLLFFHALDTIGFADWVDYLRQMFAITNMPDWVVFSMPDGLWSLAYVLIADRLMSGRATRARIAIVSIIPMMGVTSEFMQAVGLLRGTFDWADVMAYSLPLGIYLIIRILRYYKTDKNEIHK